MQEITRLSMLFVPVLLTGVAAVVQLQLKKMPYMLCAFSAALSTLSWTFWIYYTSAAARSAIIFAWLDLPLDSGTCWIISAYLYLYGALTALTGTASLMYYFVRYRTTTTTAIIVRSVLSVAVAWVMLANAPGLAKI